MSYHSASYLAEAHPQAEGTISALVQDLYVEFDVCDECGSIVHNRDVHTRWHQTLLLAMALS